MSTTFNVIPTKVNDSLTFKNVLTLARESINQYLKTLTINLAVDLSVNIHDENEAYVRQAAPDDKFIWSKKEYAFFTVGDSGGGTDAYCQSLAEQLLDHDSYVEDTLHNVPVTPGLKQQIVGCGYEWYFRRSVGQPTLICIAYGHLAAAVAKLTDGYIYTYDGAWHGDIFPATADQFLEVYYYPEKATDVAEREWTTGSINGLKKKFNR